MIKIVYHLYVKLPLIQRNEYRGNRNKIAPNKAICEICHFGYEVEAFGLLTLF